MDKNKKKWLAVLSRTAILGLILTAASSKVSAKPSAIDVNDSDGKVYEYQWEALKDSALAETLNGKSDSGAKLYNDFIQRRMSIEAYYDDVRKAYIGFDVISKAAIDAALSGGTKKFDFETFLEDTNNPTTTLDANQVAVDENGNILVKSPFGNNSDLSDKGTHTSNYEISNTGTFGASDAANVTTINGNISIKDVNASESDSIVLQNLNINGTLNVDFGEGSLKLYNVKVNNVDISNIGAHSADALGNTYIASATMHDSNNDGRILVGDSASIGKVTVASGGRLEIAPGATNPHPFTEVVLAPGEAPSPTNGITFAGGGFDSVEGDRSANVAVEQGATLHSITANSDLNFSGLGRIVFLRVANPKVTVTLPAAPTGTVLVTSTAVDSKVIIPSGGNVDTLNVDARSVISGPVRTVNLGANEVTMDSRPTNIGVVAGVTATVAGQTVNSSNATLIVAVPTDSNPAVPVTSYSGGGYVPPVDTTPPTVTAAAQTVTNGTGQTVNVSSSEGTGNVYIIKDGEPQTTVANFNTAISAHKGAAASVVFAGQNVAVSTTGLVAGTYHAYAVDAAGNISVIGGNAITINAAPSSLSGTAGISGIAQVGQTLTAALTGGNNTGALTYTWKSGTTTLGTGSTYVVQGSDLGNTITVEITSSVETGTVTSSATSSVISAAPGAAVTGLDGTLQMGETTTATAGTSEGGAGTWTSSNTAVATVDAATGAVTAVGAGTTTISYTTSTSGNVNSKTITVYAAASTANPTIGAVQVGEGNVTPAGFTAAGTGETIAWTSSDTGKATVDVATGVITPVAAGNTTISYKVTETSTGRVVAKGSTAITVQAAAVKFTSLTHPSASSDYLVLTFNSDIASIGSASDYQITFVSTDPNNNHGTTTISTDYTISADAHTPRTAKITFTNSALSYLKASGNITITVTIRGDHLTPNIDSSNNNNKQSCSTCFNNTSAVGGTVSAGTGSPTITGLTVNLYAATDTGFTNSLGTATVASDGTYTINNSVANGNYVVRIAAGSGNQEKTANVTVNGAAVTNANLTVDAPAAPNAAGAAITTAAVESSKTSNSITVTAASASTNPGSQNIEYAISTSGTTAPTSGWQAGLTFSGLNESTGYYVWARTAAKTGYDAGTEVASAVITTDAAPKIESVELYDAGTAGFGNDYNDTIIITFSKSMTDTSINMNNDQASAESAVENLLQFGTSTTDGLNFNNVQLTYTYTNTNVPNDTLEISISGSGTTTTNPISLGSTVDFGTAMPGLFIDSEGNNVSGTINGTSLTITVGNT